MSSIRLRCDPARIPDPAQHVRSLHGPAARIVAAEEVRVGGIAGFFAKRYLDLVVEVPEPSPGPFGAPGGVGAASAGGGIEALLAAADLADAAVFPADAQRPISTEGTGFDRVLSDLRATVAPPAPRHQAPPRRPVLPRRPGELLMVAGLLNDPLAIAAELAGSDGLLRIGGGLESRVVERIDDARTAVAQRKAAAERGVPIVLAWGLGRGDPTRIRGDVRIRRIAADRVWAVVDPARKHEDSRAWIAALGEHRPVEAYLPVESVHTGSPGTVGTLGLPQGVAEPVG